MTTTEPKRPAILPPNHPDRPDWGLLSDALQLPAHEKPTEGMTEEEGAAGLQALLMRCVENEDTYTALLMKCGARTIQGVLESDFGTAGQMDKALDFVKSRLWNRRADGALSESRTDREFSVNSVIQAWRPENGGIYKYLQVNISNVMRRDWRQQLMFDSPPKHTSLDQVQESGRELASDGTFVSKGEARHSPDDSVDYVENEEAASSLADANPSWRKREAQELDESDSAEDEESDGKEGRRTRRGQTEEVEQHTPARAEFEAALKPTINIRSGDLILETSENPDFSVLSAALGRDTPEPAMGVEARNDQLRDLAYEVIETHMADHPIERDECLEAVREDWVPAGNSFAAYFPDVIPEIRQSLDQAGQETKPAIDLQSEFELDLVEAANSLARHARIERAAPQGISEFDWAEIHAQVDGWFGAVAEKTEDLRSPERPDYIALCALTQRPYDPKIKPEAMGEALKTMSNEWMHEARLRAWELPPEQLHNYATHFDVVAQVYDRMAEWDPLQDGYAGELILSHFQQIRTVQSEAEQTQRRHEAGRIRKRLEARESNPVEPRPSALPDPHQALMFDEKEFKPVDPEEPEPIEIPTTMPTTEQTPQQEQKATEPEGPQIS